MEEVGAKRGLGEIQRIVGDLEATSKELQDELESLAELIRPILRQQNNVQASPSAEKSLAAPCPTPSSSLGETLFGLNRNLRLSLLKISELRSDCQL